MSGREGNRGLAAMRLEAVAELVRTAPRPMTPMQRMEGLRQVSARLATRRRRRNILAAFALLGTAATATAAVVLVRIAKHAGASAHQALAYQIEGGEIGDGGYVRASDPTSGALLRFNEGTEFRLMNGARGRLTSVDERGARLAIEEGEAEVKVTPRPGARWLVDAGPFLITVRGTVFTASWTGATEQLDVTMKKGLVSVTGPLADGVLAVRAGQRLTVDMRRKEVLLRQIDGTDGELGELGPGSEPGATPVSSASTSAAVDALGVAPLGPAPAGSTTGAHVRAPGTTRATALSSRSVASGSAARTWAALLATGDLDSILRDAEHRGLHRAIAGATSDDLAALADAARYRRRDGIAVKALIAQRDRFPSSSRARDSAFLLGRLEEAQPGGGERALQWYDLYLKEAPSGAYSSEALGRKMTATERLLGIPAAREVADEYLRRFPNGTYAGAARALRDTP